MQLDTTTKFPQTWKEILDELEINGSAPVEKKDGAQKAIKRSFQNSPKEFKIRKDKETGELRVWRLKDKVSTNVATEA